MKNNAATTKTKPFLLPTNAEWFFRDLTDEQAGKLIKDLFAYHNRGVRRKYKVSNKVGIYLTQIIADTEEMLIYYKDKGLL